MATSDYPDLSQGNSNQEDYPDLSSMEKNSSDNSAPDPRAVQKQLFEKAIGANTTPFGNVRDFLYGWGHAGANLAQLVNPNAPAMPDIRPQNSNPAAEALGQYAPFAISGGSSLLGSTLGAGAYGATQYDPSQHGMIDTLLNKEGIDYSTGKTGRVRSTAEDIALNALFHGLTKVGESTDNTFSASNKGVIPQPAAPPSLDFRPKGEFLNNKSEFNNTPFNTPSYLNQAQPKVLSGDIADNISSNIMGNRTLEQSGKELASSIKDTYQGIKKAHSDEFDRIFNEPTGETSIQTDEPILTKDKLMFNSDYLKNNSLENTNDKNLSLLNNKFINKPSIENAHNLQSELGSEIGYMKKQRENGVLDAEGKNKLNDYVQSQNTIQQDIRGELNNINPQLMNDYDQARDAWRQNVIPYHTDKDLRNIAEGRIKNPEAGQVVGIFRNPEDNINKVVNDLPDNAKDRIAHIALGKVKEDLTPEQLLNARKSLDLNGMSSYINPNDEQSFRNLRSNLQMEKDKQTQADANQTFIDELKKIQSQSERDRYKAANKRDIQYNKVKDQSQKVQQSTQKGLDTDYQKGLKEQADKAEQERKVLEDQKNATKNFYKKLLVGGGAILGARELGLNMEDILAAHLAKFPSKYWGKNK